MLEAERVADRLRVLGPRWAARDRVEDTEALAAVRATLQELADLAADASAEPRRTVPELALHALADQIAVLAAEARAVGAADPSEAALTTLRHRL